MTDSRPGFSHTDAGRGIARYLGLTMREVDGARPGLASIIGTAPTIDHLRTPNGGVAMGALLALADSVGGLCAGLAALPGWVVTTNLMLRGIGLDVIGPIDLEATVERVGRNAVITTVSVRDRGSDHAIVAEGSLTSAVLQPENGPPEYERPLTLTAPPLDPSTLVSLSEFLGVRPTAANQLSLVITEPLRNPWGILHGGATAALVDLAGVHAIAGSPAASTTPATTDAVLHFASPGRVGPVTATVLDQGARSDGRLLRIEVRDTGADDRLMALAVTTVRPT